MTYLPCSFISIVVALVILHIPTSFHFVSLLSLTCHTHYIIYHSLQLHRLLTLLTVNMGSRTYFRPENEILVPLLALVFAWHDESSQVVFKSLGAARLLCLPSLSIAFLYLRPCRRHKVRIIFRKVDAKRSQTSSWPRSTSRNRVSVKLSGSSFDVALATIT